MKSITISSQSLKQYISLELSRSQFYSDLVGQMQRYN